MWQTSYAFSAPLLLAATLALAGHATNAGQPPTMRAVRLHPGSARLHDLLALEGAGTALVKRIVLVRTVLDLSDPASLRWVPGIGARRLHQWWPWLADNGG